MDFAELVLSSTEVGSTRSRKAKTDALAAVLAATPTTEIGPAAALLAGAPRQGKVGVGWAALRDIRAAMDGVGRAGAPVSVTEVDEMFTDLGDVRGSGSTARRRSIIEAVMRRLDPSERDVLQAMILGDLGQGALESLVVDGLAKATTIPAAVVRRAHMLSGDLASTATIAALEGRAGLEAVTLRIGRGVLPMLASTAESVTAALEVTGPASIEQKLDGARIQAHRTRDGEITIYTRNLNDVTQRLASVVAVVASLPGTSLVLDGEVLGLDPDGRPRAFQDTMSSFGSEEDDGRPDARGPAMVPFFFDILHRDGQDLIDHPLSDRLTQLEAVAGPHRLGAISTDDPATAEAFTADTLAAGHEGVMVKALGSTYDAGRRGKSWQKVKPVHTLDLVVLGVEWGHGRRTGWLSNLHLGARDPEEPGRFVMVGKTFKGLTDELLAWQTAALLDLALDPSQRTPEDGWVVPVRPELVVEIALDGAQRSTTYPGGVALRFARVRGYRTDKAVADADDLDAIRALLA